MSFENAANQHRGGDFVVIPLQFRGLLKEVAKNFGFEERLGIEEIATLQIFQCCLQVRVDNTECGEVTAREYLTY